MTKIISLLMVTLMLSGCGWFNRAITANVTGFSRHCVDGVMYYQFPSGTTVAYNQDSTVKVCK